MSIINKVIITALLLALAGGPAAAQTGQYGSGQILGNSGASSAPPKATTLTAIIDRALGSTQGNILYRNATAWVVLAPGTNGQSLTSGGAAANVSWTTIAATTPGGSNTQVQFNNSSAFGGSANLTWVSPALTIGVAGSATGQLKMTGATSGTITIQGLAAAGTYNWNWPQAAGTAGQPLLSGGGGAAAQTYGTLGIAAGGSGQATASAALAAFGGVSLTATSQAFTGGIAPTAVSETTGSVTVNCGTGPLHYIQNTGAWQITAPAADGSCILLVSNGPSAATPSYSGFKVGTSTGDAWSNSVKGSATCTITIASPGVVTYTTHGLPNGAPVYITTTGALPTGLTASTIYYTVSVAANSFQLSATAGGSAINTSGSQSGVHTCNESSQFSIHVWRINATSGYRIAAHQ